MVTATAEHRELVANMLQFRGGACTSVGIGGHDARIIADVLSTEETISAEVFELENAAASGFSGVASSHFSCFLLNQVNIADANGCIRSTLDSMAAIIKPGGHLLIRQDLGSSKWNLSQLTQMLDEYRAADANATSGHYVKFELVAAFPMNASIYGKLYWSDFLWILQRTSHKSDGTDFELTRDFLDNQQFSNTGILAYEWIFGHGFISPGGSEQNREFVKQLHLRPGMVVLDVGAGIGGNSEQMAAEFGVHVIGVDLSSNMTNIAIDRANKLKDPRITFLVADVCKYDFAENTFDVIYSRDVIHHIPEKHELFARFYRWLKPGGKCFFTSYNRGESEFTETFNEFVSSRKYELLPVRKCAETLTSVGFGHVEGIDITDKFEKILNDEIRNAETNKTAFFEKFSKEKYDHLIEGWKNKIGYISNGDHKWGLFKALKPRTVI